MLDVLRKKMKLVFWVIAIPITLALAMFYGGSRPGKTRPTQYAGRVFGKKVSWDEYHRAGRALRDQGSSMDPWHRIVLLYEAKRRDIRVGDEEVIKEVQNISFLQEDGRFAPERYDAYLAFLRLDRRTFEEEVRETLAIGKLLQAIRDEVVVDDDEVRAAYREAHEKVRVDYLLFEWEGFKEKTSLADEEIVSWWEKNKTDFRVKEQVNVEFISFPCQEWEDKVEVGEEEIAQHYEDNKDLFRKSRDEAAEGEEYLPLDEVKEKIKKGLNREKAARAAEEECRKVSRELQDSTQGWEIIAENHSRPIEETGFFTRNELIPRIGWSSAFMQIAFSISPEEISEPTRIGESVYLFRLKAKRPAHIPSLDEIRDEVKEALLEEKTREAAKRRAESVWKEIGGDGAKFEEVGRENNIPREETNLFTRDDYLPGIEAGGEFTKAAFELNENNPISGVVSIPKGCAILRFKEFISIGEERFAEEKEEFRERILGRKQIEHHIRWWSNLLQEAVIESCAEKAGE